MVKARWKNIRDRQLKRGKQRSVPLPTGSEQVDPSIEIETEESSDVDASFCVEQKRMTFSNIDFQTASEVTADSVETLKQHFRFEELENFETLDTEPVPTTSSHVDSQPAPQNSEVLQSENVAATPTTSSEVAPKSKRRHVRINNIPAAALADQRQETNEILRQLITSSESSQPKKTKHSIEMYMEAFTTDILSLPQPQQNRCSQEVKRQVMAIITKYVDEVDQTN